MGVLFVAAFLWFSESFDLPEPQDVNVSWYGPGFHGREMANGEMFNKHDPGTIAHRSLPFGTIVLLYCPESARSCVSVVRDRGPFVTGRDFDISEAGADALGFKDKGVAHLKAYVVFTPPEVS